RGLGEKAARVDRKRAQATRDVNTLDRLDKASAVVRDVVQAYWELAYTIEELEIRKSSLDLAREQLRVTQARLDVGVGAPTDLAEVKQTIATREEDLLLSELTLSERALDVRQIAGIQIAATDIALTPTDQATPQIGDLAMDQALAAADRNNPQILVLRAQGKQARIVVEVNENGLLPQLDLNASIGPAGAAADADTALRQMVNFDNYAVNVGLT